MQGILANPQSWYPQARSLPARTIIAHVGPTNSGKTHGAMQALLAAPTGTYCGPLRLLAQEQYNRCHAGGDGGVKMSLRTGEMVASWRQTRSTNSSDNTEIATKENQTTRNWRADGATHLSCTVEMADLQTTTSVAVLDEVQLMADEERGWAFTQCLLGVPAHKVFVCGEEAAVPLLSRLCKLMNAELVVKRFERLSPLKVVEEPVSVEKLAPGDAIIAFSRSDIFQLKRIIEHRLKRPNSCAVVYGGLPLEHRLAQAELFNSGKVPFLIASDAIGLGLNLNIGRILFTSLRKYQHDTIVPVDSRLVRQIGGRAGRFASGFDGGGSVGVLQLHDGVVGVKQGKELFGELERSWNKPPIPYKRAGIIPPDHIILDLADHDPLKLEPALTRSRQCQFTDTPFFHCHVTPQLLTLQAIKPSLGNIDASTALLLAKAPVRHPRPASLIVIESMAAHLAACLGPTDYRLPRLHTLYTTTAAGRKPREERLGDAEECYRALELYKWVSLRFPHAFGVAEQSERFVEEQRLVDAFITDNLR